MIDKDLALLYGVETKRLNELVKRNVGRFPEEFIFQLTMEEIDEEIRLTRKEQKASSISK